MAVVVADSFIFRDKVYAFQTKYDLKHLVLQPLHPIYWGYRHKPLLCSVYTGLETEPRALGVSGKHLLADLYPKPM